MKSSFQQTENRTNRSMPSNTIIPELAYTDVRKAVTWLCQTFGFEERLRIGDHRAQLVFGDGSVVITHQSIDPAIAVSKSSNSEKEALITPGFSMMVRVDNVDAHYEYAKLSGARIINPPTDYPYGERQYSVEDIGGYLWTFSQTIADTDPDAWGGMIVK